MIGKINDKSAYEYDNGILKIYSSDDLVFSGEVEEFLIEDTIAEIEEEGKLYIAN